MGIVWPDPGAPRATVDDFMKQRRRAAREAWAKSPRIRCPLCDGRLVQVSADDGLRLSCPDEACDFIVRIEKFGPCTDCGHHHAGKPLAGICIGCPCPFIDGKDVRITATVLTADGGIPAEWTAPNREAS